MPPLPGFLFLNDLFPPTLRDVFEILPLHLLRSSPPVRSIEPFWHAELWISHWRMGCCFAAMEMPLSPCLFPLVLAHLELLGERALPV